MIEILTKEILDKYYNDWVTFKQQQGCPQEYITKFGYLCDEIFNLTTYDADISAKWGYYIYKTLCVIRDKEQFENIKDPLYYHIYLIVCNLLEKKDWIDWGTSIRGCWFNYDDYVGPSMDEIKFTQNNLEFLLDWMKW